MLYGTSLAVMVVIVLVGVVTRQAAVAAMLVVVPVAISAAATVVVTGGFAVGAVGGAVGLGWVRGWTPVVPQALVVAGVATGATVAVVVAAVRARDEMALAAAQRGRERERRRRRAAEARNRLQHLSAALAACGSVADVAETTFASLRTELGSGAALLALRQRRSGSPDSSVRFLQQFGYRPDVLERWPSLPLDADTPGGAVVRTGQPIFSESADAFARRWPRVAADVVDSGFEGLALLPLVVSSRSIGFLAVSWRQRRRFSDDERQFLQGLADQCAQAVERARLSEDERRARRRLAFLGDVTRLLTSLLDPAAVLVRLVDLVVGSMADACAVLVPDGPVLVRQAGSDRGRRAGLALRELLGVGSVPVEAENLVAEAWRSGHPVAGAPGWSASTGIDRPIPVGADGADGAKVLPAESSAAPPGTGSDMLSPAILAVPLLAGGERLGVMVFVSGIETPAFGGEDASLASEVAARASTALYNARRFQHERDVAELLQRSMLPDELPVVPGLVLDAVYRAGTAGTEVGGDWFDAVALDDGRLLVSVGDVMGKGVAAAAFMSQVRSALRAYGVADPRPANALAQLDRLLATLGETRLVTAVVATVDPRSGRVCLASAGHLAPLVVGPGRLLVVDGGRQRILGASVPDRRSMPAAGGPGQSEGIGHDEVVVDLGPGDTLVLYSDGLIERRGEPITEGIGRLGAAASACLDVPGWPDRAAARLLDHLGVGEGADDDVVVLTISLSSGGPARPAGSGAGDVAVARDVAPGGIGAPIVGASVSGTVVLPPRRDSVPAARHWLAELLVGMPDDLRQRSVLLLGELVANAVIHAATDVAVGVRVDGSVVHVEVADHSSLLPVDKRFGPEAGTGRGLLLVRSMCRAWGVERHPTGKVVWFEVDEEEPDQGSPPDVPAEAGCSGGSRSRGGEEPPRVAPSDGVTVDLIGVPADLAVRTVTHYESLVRELRMVVAAADLSTGAAPNSSPPPGISQHDLAAVLDRIEEVVEALAAAMAPAIVRWTAAGTGAGNTGTTIEFSSSAGRRCSMADRTMDDIDRFCRDGSLLSMPAPAEVVAFRHWLLRQVADQCAGAKASPWTGSATSGSATSGSAASGSAAELGDPGSDR